MIQMVGTDHRLAPVEIRSLFMMSREKQCQLMDRLRQNVQIKGGVVLSTCNRIEVWIDTDSEEKFALAEALCDFCGIEDSGYRSCLKERVDGEAVEHLFFLTCGLRSAILAEDQVLSQVKSALDFARERKFSDSCMEVLFRMAVTAAKRVKTEVTFTRADATAIGQAISILSKEGIKLNECRCMVIGNGEYGKLAASTLIASGADVTVTVRAYHAGEVKVPTGCRTISYSDRIEYFPACDIVVSATTSPHYTISREAIAGIEPDHPMILIDLAAPRDIDPGIKDLAAYRVFDIDDFRSEDRSLNRESYETASVILEDEMDAFWFWYNNRDLVPRIRSIQSSAVRDFQLRMRKLIRRLPLSDGERQILSDQMETAAGKSISKMIFELQDFLPDSEFRDCVGGLEKVYARHE